MNIISPINQLGYGVAGLNIVKSISKKKKVCLWPLGQPQVTNKDDFDLIQSCIMNCPMFNPDEPCLRIWHQHDMSQFVGKSLRIGFPFFELDQFTDIEKHQLSTLDKIFVCSEWAKEICDLNTSVSERNISVVPLGVDINIFKPCKTNQSSKTVFFNCGKWEVRKGHDVLVDIFNKSFEPNDDVELWMMTSNPFLSPQQDEEWKKLYKNSKLGDKIKFIDRVESQSEVYNIMAKTDCGVFPSRAEGWNLELLEMMSCGKSVVATNYSAHTEFCNDLNTTLVDVQEKEIAYDGKWFHGNCGQWAKISSSEVDLFVDSLRSIHNSKKSGLLKENTSGIETAQKFTWDETATKILEYSNV